MRSERPLPTGDEVQRLYYEAFQHQDARAVPGVLLVVLHLFSVRRLQSLRWANWDGLSGLLIIPSGRWSEAVLKTDRRLAARIGQMKRNPSPLMFAPPDVHHPAIGVLLTFLLARAGLSRYVMGDILAWSQAQTPTARLAAAN